jgi:nicotinamidase-related amidase
MDGRDIGSSIQRGKQPNSLAAQLKISAPEIKTYQALVIFGLQQDFVSPEGVLPVDTASGFMDRILALVPKFRDRAGHIIWVRSDTTAEATADAFVGAGKTVKKFFGSLDKELEKTSGPDMMPPDGLYQTSDFPEEVKAVVKPASDFIIEKKFCSAFTSSRFQMTLHQNLIGDVYVCGTVSEITIYAFARDAASRGLRLHIIEDCLGYRNRSRNDYAIRRMVAHMNGQRILSTEIHQELDEPLKQAASVSDLADMMTSIIKVETPQLPNAKTTNRREVLSRHSRSEYLVLPSGELKKKSSRTRIYTRRPSKIKSLESERQPAPETETEPQSQPVPDTELEPQSQPALEPETETELELKSESKPSVQLPPET